MRCSAICAAVLTALALARSATAASVPVPTAVVLSPEPACAPADRLDRLVEALRLRLAGTEIELGPDADDPDAVRWAADAAGTCQLSLDTLDGRATLDLGPGATDTEIDGAAVRIAWWLELRARHAEVTPPPIVVAQPPDPPRADPPPPATPPLERVRLAAQFGPSYYPTPDNTAGILRVAALIRVVDRLWLGLEARLGTEVGLLEPLDVDVYDRSVGLQARYDSRPAPAIDVGVTVGLRYALPEFDTDLADAVEPVDELSNLSIVTGVDASIALTDALRVRADVLVGVSVLSRRLTSEVGAAGDLGVLALDFLAGFELAL